jgi:hypothetical protein
VGVGTVATSVAVAIAACAPAEPRLPSVQTVGVPGLANAHVSAAGDGPWVALAWSASSEAMGTNVYVAVSRDAGSTFSDPVRVNDEERQASANGEQPPRIVVVRAQGSVPSIVVVWTARLETGTVLLQAASRDGGRSFGPSAPLPGGSAAGNRGWHSITADADGRVYAVWLDHRDTAAQSAGAHTMHQHGTGAAAAPEDGVARAQRSQLFVGSADGSIPSAGIARGVCYCCKTAVLAGGDGSVFAAWRHVYPGNQRDIAFTVSRDRGRSFAAPVRVSEDGWRIDACPENGPSLAADGMGRVHVLWPTLVAEGGRETLKLFVSSTTDGLTFTPRTELPIEGAAYHPQIVAGPDGSLFAAWDEVVTGAPRRVRVARGRVDANGTVAFELLDLGGSGTGSYPALAAASDRLVMAWTAPGGSQSSISVESIPY